MNQPSDGELEILENLFHMTTEESDPIQEAMSRATEILDTDYKKANIDNIVEEYTHLNSKEKSKLKSLLFKHESLFDGTLGTWKTDLVNLELKPGATPYYGHPYQIPYIYEQTL